MALDLERVYPKEFGEKIKAAFESGDAEAFYSIQEDVEMKSILHRLNYCFELLREGREEDAAELISRHIGNDHKYGRAFSSQGCLATVAERFKNKVVLYNLIRDVYTQDGYGFPRKLIIKMKKLSHGIPEDERLEGLCDGDPVTVYRASATDNEKAIMDEISWTTNYDVAVFFAYKEYLRFRDMGGESNIIPLHIWKAEIPRKKIITYCNERNEYEVIQHHGVVNAIILPMPTDSEVERVMREHEEQQMQSIHDAINGIDDD